MRLILRQKYVNLLKHLARSRKMAAILDWTRKNISWKVFDLGWRVFFFKCINFHKHYDYVKNRHIWQPSWILAAILEFVKTYKFCIYTKAMTSYLTHMFFIDESQTLTTSSHKYVDFTNIVTNLREWQPSWILNTNKTQISVTIWHNNMIFFF